jgi:predicted transcriptional regulator YdeE
MNFKYLTLVTTITVFAACAGKKESNEHTHGASETKAELQQDTIRKSIPKEEHAQVGNAHITIKYHAPAVRGRMIWGGLVPYGDVWVTGAHSATSFEIDKAFVVNNHEIPAGKYALFTIPDKDTWTIIINKNWDQHLTDEYDQKLDVIRIQTRPEPLSKMQERLKYAVVTNGNSAGTVLMTWEKVKISLPFKMKE